MVSSTIESVISSSRDLPVARRAITAPFASLASGWWHVVRPATRAPRYALIEARSA